MPQLAMAGDGVARGRLEHMLMSGFGTKQGNSDLGKWLNQIW